MLKARQPAPRKRRKIASQSTNEAASTVTSSVVLQQILEGPVDILFEVFGHVLPQDLVSLARTSKYMRGLVLSRGWRSVWRSALENDPDGFPPMPDDMTEPQYVSLTCDRFCDTCLREQSITDYWVCRRRLCPDCSSGLFIQFFELQRIWMDNQQAFPDYTTMLEVIPSELASYTQYFRREDLDRFKNDMQACAGNPGALQAYKKKRTNEVEALHTFRNGCRDAMTRRRQRTDREMQEARDRRKEEIFNRLRALGYSEEITFLLETTPQVLTDHPDVYSTTEMTDAVFNRIRAKLLTIMNDARETVVRRKQKRLNGTRLSLLFKVLEKYTSDNPNKILPSLADLVFLPKIQKILRIKDIACYSTEESFADIRNELPKLCKEWRRMQNETLAALLAPQGMNISHLPLAITFFKCHECTEPISYPRILAHECLRQLRPGYRNRDDEVVALLTALGEEPWNLAPRHGVKVHEYAKACAVDVVCGYGLNPALATPQDMDIAAVQWVECLACRDPRRQRSVVFQWRSAVVHGLKHFAAREPASWAPVNRPEDIKVAEDEDERLGKRLGNGAHNVCRRCDVKVERHVRRDHLRLAHPDIENPSQLRLDAEFGLTQDAPQDQQPYTILIPIARRQSFPQAGAVIDLTGDAKPGAVVDLTGDDEDEDEKDKDNSIIVIDSD